MLWWGKGPRRWSLWFEKMCLKKRTQEPSPKSKSTNVIVSGTCYGGQFYDSVSCGFFGAHPKTPAVGCWALEDHIISQRDYTRTFFSSLNSINRDKADFNKNGFLSFEEMHWFALLNGPKQDLPFTSIDGLARRFFRTHQKTFKKLGSIRNLDDLLPYASPGEKVVLKSLTKKIEQPLKESLLFEETPRKTQSQGGYNSFKIGCP